MSAYPILRGLTPPSAGRPSKRTSLNDLVNLAQEMEVGDAVMLRLGEANTFRIAVMALGFHCITDGYRCPDKTRVYAFKLAWQTDYQI